MPRVTQKRSGRSEKPYESSGSKAVVGGRLYVGNLDWTVSWQDLKDHFRRCGEVVRADVMMESDGKSKGCGIVEYASNREANDAIRELSDTELKGRMIFVREDRESGGGGGGSSHRTTTVYPGGAREGSRASGSKLYVGNLAFEVRWQDLKDHFKQHGTVLHADVLMEGTRSKGYGTVEMSTTREAEAAIRRFNGTDFMGRDLIVREDKFSDSSRGSAPGTSVYVGNLAYSVSWHSLKDHFKACGNVLYADVLIGADGRSKGCGIVRFETAEEAESAIRSLNDTEIEGTSRPIFVREDREAK